MGVAADFESCSVLKSGYKTSRRFFIDDNYTAHQAGMSMAGALYFEDYTIGRIFESEPIGVTEEEIIQFASRYDPQPFHVDKKAAEQSIYGGVIASGWHTAGLMMRRIAECYLFPESSLGSPGLDELRWPSPVRPGDALRVVITVDDARLSRSRPDRGIVVSNMEARNQNDQAVMSFRVTNFIRCRP